MTNDRRMVPAGGVSDEEIDRLAEDAAHGFVDDGGTDEQGRFIRLLIRAALARRGAQPEPICPACGKRYVYGEICHDANPIYPGAQTEYDHVKVEALLQACADLQDSFGPYDKPDPVNPFGRPVVTRRIGLDRMVAFDAAIAAVRSSRRPRGRVVEGWAVEEDGELSGLWLVKGFAERRADIAVGRGDAMVVRVVPCRIEILDAPEEG